MSGGNIGKTKFAFGKPKLDPKKFMFVNQSDQELVKLPGEINGQAFKIENLNHCTVYLLDHFAQIYVDNVHDCKIFVGAIKSSIQVRNSTNCSISAVCGQYRCTECKNFQLYLCVNSEPTIESSHNLSFAPYNFGYPGLEAHIEAAQIESRKNLWKFVHDMTPVSGEKHWDLLSPLDFEIAFKEIEGQPEPELVVPYPIIYGGTQPEDEEATLETSVEGFDIARSKEEAQKQRAVLEEPHEEKKTSAPTKLSDFSFPPGVSAEEFELIRKKEQADEERHSVLMEKIHLEQKKKKEMQEKAAIELRNWLSNYYKESEAKKAKNREAQRAQLSKDSALSKPSWKNILILIENKEAVSARTKDVGRMKKAMENRANDD